MVSEICTEAHTIISNNEAIMFEMHSEKLFLS